MVLCELFVPELGHSHPTQVVSCHCQLGLNLLQFQLGFVFNAKGVGDELNLVLDFGLLVEEQVLVL